MRRALGLWVLFLAGEASAGVGRHSSVAVGTDGLALISCADNTNGTVKVAHCSNAACTSATVTTLFPGAGRTSLVIGADGLGLILTNAGTIGSIHCANVECTSATQATLVVPGFQGSVSVQSGGALAMGADGRGLFSYLNFPLPRYGLPYLQVGHCSDAPCTAATFTTVASSDGVGGPGPGGAAIGPDGLGLLTYTNRTGCPSCRYSVLVRHCGDAACSSGSSAIVGDGSRTSSVAIGADGFGLLPWSPDGDGLRVTHCTDTSCTASSTVVLDAGAGMTKATAARGPDGLGLIAYVMDGRLKVAHCSDLACSAATITSPDSAAGVYEAHLAIGADGLGLISYNDWRTGALKVAHCENVECTSATVSVLDSVPLAADLAVSLTHSPEPVGGLLTLNYYISVLNFGPDPSPGMTVTQTLPPGVPFVSAGGDGWSCAEAGGIVTCSRPDNPPGTPYIRVQVTAPATAQVLSSTATVSSPITDPVSQNNTDTDTATVLDAVVSDVAITQSDGGVVGRWGQPFTWTITASNAGPAWGGPARVIDAFPDGVAGVTWTCVASSGANCPASGSGTPLDTIVGMPVGSSVTFTVTGTLRPYTFGLTNTASVSPWINVYDPVPANNTATLISAVEPTRAHTLAPCRVVDTRTDPPALGANTTREFTVGGTCGVPADARAVAVIATAVNPGELGNLRLFAAGTPMPLASMLNFATGRTRANNAIIPLGAGGRISVRCDMAPGSTAATDLVLDVTAYFK